MSTITIRDETTAGAETGRLTLDFPTERIRGGAWAASNSP
ncbi:hypothetical protein PHYC_00976 [Phycisphaerales bacterium]|nr:hypothetical protein PHYC_00976 [Phycisphaerales bacterium]